MSLRVSGLGAWPGDEPLLAHQAIVDAFVDGPVPGLPHLAVLTERGPWAAPIGRTLALAESTGASLEPHGWRLGSSSHEQHLAHSTLALDIEAFAIASSGYSGPVALPVLGPLSLAASVWLPVGERALADRSAVEDLTAALAVGVRRHAEAVAHGRGLGPAEADSDARAGASTTIVLHEPLLEHVVRGGIPTFSGMSRLRTVEPTVASELLRSLVRSWDGFDVVLVVPPNETSIAAARAAGVKRIATDLTVLDRAGWDELATAVEAGIGIWASSVPHHFEGVKPNPGQSARAILAPWRAVGLETSDWSPVLSARPGLGELSPDAARATLRDVGRTAAELAELIA